MDEVLHRRAVGFPSPADDYLEGRISLDRFLIKHRESTFIMRAEGSAVKEYGISHNDLLIIDRSMVPKHNQLIVSIINGDFAIKKYNQYNPSFDKVNNKNYTNEITTQIEIWGVIVWVIHKLAL